MGVKRKKILIVMSDIHKALEHEWFIELIDHDRFEFEFFQINALGTEMDKFISSHGLKTYHSKVKNKIDLVPVIVRLIILMLRNRYDAIHAHLFIATFTSMLASRLVFMKNRIYTRHHSDYHHVYFPSVVKYDILNNRLASKIIAVSSNVRHILINEEKVPAKKVVTINHGFKLDLFAKFNVSSERLDTVKQSYKIFDEKFVIGVISRYTEWKGVHYIIEAFRLFNQNNPNSLLVLANAHGDYEAVIREKLKALPNDSYREIRFENDSAALFNCFDVFVHTPIDSRAEAFGQVYIEALAAGLPCVFTLSGIATDFIVDKQNAVVVPFKDSASINSAFEVIYNDTKFAKYIGDMGQEDVTKLFDISQKIIKLESLYSSL